MAHAAAPPQASNATEQPGPSAQGTEGTSTSQESVDNAREPAVVAENDNERGDDGLEISPEQASNLAAPNGNNNGEGTDTSEEE